MRIEIEEIKKQWAECKGPEGGTVLAQEFASDHFDILIAEIERCWKITQWADQEDCQVVMEIKSKDFGLGYGKGIIATHDGTLVNMGIIINAVNK